MSHSILSILVICISSHILLRNGAYAVDVFVSNFGSDNNTGTMLFPFLTFQKAFSVVAASDGAHSIYLFTETYNISIQSTLANFTGGIVLRPYNMSLPRPTVSCRDSIDQPCLKIYADPTTRPGLRYIWFYNLIMDQVTLESPPGMQSIYFELVDWVSSTQTPCLQALDTYNIVIRNSRVACSGGITFSTSPALTRTCFLQINRANISSSVESFAARAAALTVSGVRAALYTSSFATFHDSRTPASGSIGGGCLVTNSAYFSIVDTDFINCSSANAQGGAAALWLGSGVIQRSRFIRNSATWGGAILYYAAATFTNCSFVNNSATAGAGAFLSFWSIAFTGCEFIGNRASVSYGSLYLYTSSPARSTIDRCLFSRNSVTPSDYSYGGALYTNATGGTSISDSIFEFNTATMGGALLALQNTNITRCVFSNNLAQGNRPHGGAVFVSLQGPTRLFVLSDSLLDGNSVLTPSGSPGGNGGGLALQSAATRGIILNSVFRNNIAGEGAGAVISNGLTTEIRSSSFESNVCAERGCGLSIYSPDGLDGAPILIEDSQFSNNAILPSATGTSFVGAGICALRIPNFQKLISHLNGRADANAQDITIARSVFVNNVIDTEDSQGVPFSTVYTSGAGVYLIRCSAVRVNSCGFFSNIINGRLGYGSALSLSSLDVPTRAIFHQTVFVGSRVSSRSAEFRNQSDYWVTSGAVQLEFTFSSPVIECSQSDGALPTRGVCFSRCDFSSNFAARSSSLHIRFGAATLVGCAFRNNRADAFNAAIGVAYASDSVFPGQVLPNSNITFVYNSSCYDNTIGDVFSSHPIYRGYGATCLDMQFGAQVEISNCSCVFYLLSFTYISQIQFLDQTWNNTFVQDSVWSTDILVGRNSTLLVDGNALSRMHSILLVSSNPTVELRGAESVTFEIDHFKLWAVSYPIVVLQTQRLNVISTFLSFDGLIGSALSESTVVLLPSVEGSIVSRSTLHLSNISFTNLGTINQNPSSIVLSDSSITNSGHWRMNFVDQKVQFSCLVPSWVCKFINRGVLVGNSIDFNDVPVVFAENSTLQVPLILDNGPLFISSTKSISILNATMIASMISLAGSRPPRPRERLAILSAVSIMGGFSHVDSSVNAQAPYVVDPIYSNDIMSLEFSYFLPVSVRLRQDAAAIVVTFPRPVRLPSALCADILDSISLLLFHTSTSCTQTKSKELVISSSELPAPNGTNALSFRLGAVVDAEDALFGVLDGISFPILSPEKPLQVTTLLIAPASVSHCDDFTLDASSSFGTGVFPLVFSWRLVCIEKQNGELLDNTSFVALSSKVAAETSSRLLVLASDLPMITEGNQIITVEVIATSDIFNITGTPSVLSVRRSLFADLSIKLRGPTMRRHFYPKELQLSLDVSYATCINYTMAPELSIEWSVDSDPSIAFKDKQVLVVPTGRLLPGRNYSIQASVSMSRSSYFERLAAWVFVDSVPPFSIRSMGDSGVISSTDGIISLEMQVYNTLSNSAIENLSDFSFAAVLKNCPGLSSAGSTIGFNPFGEGFQALSLGSSESGRVAPFPTIPTGFVRCKVGDIAFVPPLNGSDSTLRFGTALILQGDYEYQFYAIHRETGIVKTRSVKFSLRPSGSPFKIRALDVFSHPLDKVVLRAQAFGEVSTNVLWSWIPANDAAASIPTRFFRSVDNSSSLIIGYGALAPSTEYAFSVRLINSSSGEIVGRSDASIITHTPPCCGSLVLDGAKNNSLEPGSHANVSAPNWADEDSPLSYQFSFVLTSATTMSVEIPVSDYVEDSQLSGIRIPVPALDFSTLVLRVRVKDSVGSVSIAETQSFSLLPVSNSSSEVSGLQSLERFTASKRFFDLAAELQLLGLAQYIQADSLLSSLLNLTASTPAALQSLLSLIASSEAARDDPISAAYVIDKVLLLVQDIQNNSLWDRPLSNMNEEGDTSFGTSLQALQPALTSNATMETLFQLLAQISQVGTIRAGGLDQEEQDVLNATSNIAVLSQRIRRPGSGSAVRPGGLNTTIDGALSTGGPLSVVRISLNNSVPLNTSSTVVAVGFPERPSDLPITITAGFKLESAKDPVCVQMDGEDDKRAWGSVGCETVRLSSSEIECRCESLAPRRVFMWVAMDIDNLFQPNLPGADSRASLTPFAIGLIACICGVIVISLIAGAIGFKYHRGRVVRAVRQVRRKVSGRLPASASASAAPAAGHDASMSETKTTSSQHTEALKQSYSDAESSTHRVARPLPPPEQLPSMVEMQAIGSSTATSPYHRDPGAEGPLQTQNSLP